MSLLPEEKRYYGQLFKIADEGGEGIINGGLAVKFFERSGLPAETLGLIWEISDKDNSGFLTQQSFSVALRLIGQAQAGRAPVASLAKQRKHLLNITKDDLTMIAGPYPNFQGIDPPSATTSRSSAPQPPKSRNVVPPLTPEDRAKYFSSWQSVNPTGGLLDGERARDVFQKSRLPVEQLGQIWALTDVRNRGSLDVTEFIVAMHLVQSAMNGTVKTLPSQLPPGLFEAAANGPSASSSRSQRQQSSISSVRSQEPLQQQFSGQRQPVPMRSQLTGPPGRNQPQAQASPVRQTSQSQAIQPQMSGQVSDSDWDVKPHEKANYDNLFNDLDKSQKGYITGEEAVSFFLQSKLPEDDLAKIWDFSDIQSSGQLNKDTFAVAMHLIKGKLGGKDLPAALPPSLIPPSMRSKMQAPVAAAFAKAQTQSQPLPPSSAAADLFDLNDSFNAPPAQPRSPPAQAFVTDNYGAIDRVASPPVVAPRAANPSGRPFNGQPAFVPSSTFGQSIQQQNPSQQTPQSPQGGLYASPQPQPPRIERDLMSDVEPEQNRNINNDTTELANLNNQKTSLDNQTRQIQQERGQIQGDVSNLHDQKRELNERLVQIRQAYDQEIQAVRAMQAEQGSLRSETRELIKEASLLEASLDAIRQQHETINTQLVKDRTDNSSIKDRIKSANEQTVTLKATLDKVQKEAKQQRGLVAINTKQLNTLEAEHEKLNAQIEEEQAEAEKHRIMAIEQERAKANAEQSLSALRSPALSTTSASTNPFHRIGSPSIDGQRQVKSPFDQIFSQTSTHEAQTPHASAIGAAAVGSAALAGAAVVGSTISNQNRSQQSSATNDTDLGVFQTDPSASQDNQALHSGHDTNAQNIGTGSKSMSGFHHAFGYTESHDNQNSPSLQTRDQAGDDQSREQFAQESNEAQIENNENESSSSGNVRDIDRSDAHSFTKSNRDPSDVREGEPEEASRSISSPSVTQTPSYAHGSDSEAVSTFAHNHTASAPHDTEYNSQALSSVPARSVSQTSQPGVESAPNEHELGTPVTPSEVQQVLTRPPHDQAFPADQSSGTERALSPQIPGSFPTQTSEHNEFSKSQSQDTQQAHGGTSDSRAIYHESGSVPQEYAAEVDSSDDETIEQPRGANFFGASDASVVSTNTSHSVDETASTHTITAGSPTVQNGFDHAVNHSANESSHYTNPTTTGSIPTSKGKEVDEFDEFDDLEEAAEGDEEEFNRSFTTTTNDFDASFEAPSARSSMMPDRAANTFSTPQIALPRHESIQASPERDFSEFAHYGAVLGDDGLAPPLSAGGGSIINSAPVTFGSRSQANPQANLQANTQAVTPQGTASPQAVPAPPASRHGATLAPKRPEPARAISAADDPMLIELMDMGFQREKSVSALEQFNYDLGAAMDFLLKGN